MNQAHHNIHWTRFADRFGATASFLCAVHCALLPLLIAALPAFGLGFLADHRYEQAFVGFAVLLASATVVGGFRHHHRLVALWLLLPGLVLLITGALIAFDHAATLHSVLVSFGGTLVAGAHLTNLRLWRGPAQRHCVVAGHAGHHVGG